MSALHFEPPPGCTVKELEPLLKAAMELAEAKGWRMTCNGPRVIFEKAYVPASRSNVVFPQFGAPRHSLPHHSDGPCAA